MTTMRFAPLLTAAFLVVAPAAQAGTVNVKDGPTAGEIVVEATDASLKEILLAIGNRFDFAVDQTSGANVSGTTSGRWAGPVRSVVARLLDNNAGHVVVLNEDRPGGIGRILLVSVKSAPLGMAAGATVADGAAPANTQNAGPSAESVNVGGQPGSPPLPAAAGPRQIVSNDAPDPFNGPAAPRATGAMRVAAAPAVTEQSPPAGKPSIVAQAPAAPSPTQGPAAQGGPPGSDAPPAAPSPSPSPSAATGPQPAAAVSGPPGSDAPAAAPAPGAAAGPPGWNAPAAPGAPPLAPDSPQAQSASGPAPAPLAPHGWKP
jgi:hypothetical protein